MTSQASATLSNSSLKKKSALDEFVAKHQQWIIGLFILPASYVYSGYLRLQKALRKNRNTYTEAALQAQHEKRVARICAEVKRWSQIPEATRPPLRTDRNGNFSHSVRTTDKSGSYTIGMQDFDQILGIDLQRNTVTIEPFVTVGEITTYLLQHNRMLEATLEMEDATLGGLALTQGMTTHSHRCGLVHDTVERFELVTGVGDCIQATTTENEDVFRAAGFSHGTLGLLTALELRIVPASRELLVTYTHFNSIADFKSEYENAILNTDAFFVEGIIFARDHAVFIRGDLLTPQLEREAKASGVKTNYQSRWHKEWFFTHAQKMPHGHQELMPMRDYLMRHDRCMCMNMKDTFPAGNHPFMRWVFGWMLPPKVSFLKKLIISTAREDTARNNVYQDLGFPKEHLESLVDYIDEHFGMYPLLVYPCKLMDRGGYLKSPNGIQSAEDHSVKEQYFLNLGVYGMPKPVVEKRSDYNTIKEVRGLLAKVRQLGGFQHSYCDVFQTKQEFYQMFDASLGDAVRKRLGSEALLDVYAKVNPGIPWDVWAKE